MNLYKFELEGKDESRFSFFVEAENWEVAGSRLDQNYPEGKVRLISAKRIRHGKDGIVDA